MKRVRGKTPAAMRKRPVNGAPTPPARRPRRTTAVGARAEDDSDGSHWTFLTNHTHVLVVLSRDPTLVLREAAARVGITERAVQRLVADLETAGIIEREKVGRKNRYRIRSDRHLRHANESHRTVGELLALLNRP